MVYLLYLYYYYYIYYLEILPAFYARISSFLIYDYLLPRKMWIKRRQTAWIIINSMQLQSPPSHPLRIISTLIISTLPPVVTFVTILLSASYCLKYSDNCDLYVSVRRIPQFHMRFHMILPSWSVVMESRKSRVSIISPSSNL